MLGSAGHPSRKEGEGRTARGLVPDKSELEMNHRSDSSPTTRGKRRLQIAAIWVSEPRCCGRRCRLRHTWSLRDAGGYRSRRLSDLPQEVGFGARPVERQASTAARPSRRGRSRRRQRARRRIIGRSAVGWGCSTRRPQGERGRRQEDQELIADAKAPSPTLTIVQSEAAVAITGCIGPRPHVSSEWERGDRAARRRTDRRGFEVDR